MARTTIKTNMTVIWLILLCVFVTELLAYTWCRVQSIRVGYGVSQALHRQQQLLKLQKNLEVELARLKSPQRIARIASQRLGLITPTPQQVIMVP